MAKKVTPRFKPQKSRHFIKQWRKFRDLTQEQLAERIGVTPGAISQIEVGRVNYTQPMLEAIATELKCRPGDLLSVDPTRDGSLWSLWEGLDPPARNQVVRIIETFGKTGTDN